MRLPVNSKPAKIAIWCVLVVFTGVVVVFGPLGERLASLLPAGESAALQVPAKKEARPQSARTPSVQKSSEQPISRMTVQPVLPQLPVAGNLEELTRLHAEIEEGLLRKKLAELPGKEAGREELPPAGAANHAKQEQAAAPVMPVFEPKPTVVSIQGVDGKLTATLRDRGAIATFRTGDRCSAGKITRITRDSVVLQGGNGTEQLFFE